MDVIWRFVKYKTQESIILPSDFDKLKSFNKSETVEKNEEGIIFIIFIYVINLIFNVGVFNR